MTYQRKYVGLREAIEMIDHERPDEVLGQALWDGVIVAEGRINGAIGHQPLDRSWWEGWVLSENTIVRTGDPRVPRHPGEKTGRSTGGQHSDWMKAADEVGAVARDVVVPQAQLRELFKIRRSEAPEDQQRPPRRPKARQLDSREDDTRRQCIEAVIAKAEQEWPQPTGRPTAYVMAKRLTRDGKCNGYSFDTVRKILDGSYPAMAKLGIFGIDTEKK